MKSERRRNKEEVAQL